MRRIFSYAPGGRRIMNGFHISLMVMATTLSCGTETQRQRSYRGSARNDPASADASTNGEQSTGSQMLALIDEHCLSCHGPRGNEPDLSDHDVIAEEAEEIFESIIEGEMPPNAEGSLSRNEWQVVQNWFREVTEGVDKDAPAQDIGIPKSDDGDQSQSRIGRGQSDPQQSGGESGTDNGGRSNQMGKPAQEGAASLPDPNDGHWGQKSPTGDKGPDSGGANSPQPGDGSDRGPGAGGEQGGDVQQPEPPSDPQPQPKPEPPGLSFARDIQPILKAKCADSSCHSASRHKSGYDFETLAGSRDGIKKGIRSIEKGDMPPKKEPDITDNELAILKEWLASGLAP